MITGLNHITLAVTQLDRSLAFYCDLLGCTLVHRWAEGAYLEAGNLWLCLSVGERVDKRTDYSHIAFTTTSDALPSLRARVAEQCVSMWQENISEGDSLYINDPDGHRLEVHVGDLQSRLTHIHSSNASSPSCGSDV